MRKSAACLYLIFFLPVISFSQLRLPAIIASGMVLQQNDSVSFWGWGHSGQQVKVNTSWDNATATATISNTAKWSIKLKTPAAGGPYTVRISSTGGEFVLNDIMIGEVWLCSGQSNMQWSYYNGAGYIKQELPTSFNNKIRFFNIPQAASDHRQEDLKAKWQVCDSNSLKAFSAVGYYFGKKLQQELDVPIGLINASWGGTPAEVWIPDEYIYANDSLKEAAVKKNETPWWPIKPGVTYNAMLAPIVKYNIAGAIWYQGESNAGTNNTYARLLALMIDAWRIKWKKEFPFYYVQIAPYKYGNHNVGALLQEQQTKVMAHPNTGMVVITDLVDSVTDIHPSNKRDVGNRLANWALAETYHKTMGPYKSPVFDTMRADKGKLILGFSHVPNGLIAKDKTITGFYISGQNEDWIPAEARIDKNKIIVWNKKLKQPVHVRYGFGNTIIGNVFSKEGLPLTPFRTDNWPVDQEPVKN